MNLFNLQSQLPPRVLATDLDGTLIPLAGNEKNRADLQILKDGLALGGHEVIFATGRYRESVQEAIKEYGLPVPEWMICDVGTSIYRREDGNYERFQPYVDHLTGVSGGIDRSTVEEAVSKVSGIELQGPESQGPFKISYFCEPGRVDEIAKELERRCAEKSLPFLTIGSVDPFDGSGLLDLLPRDVSKAYALIWLADHAEFDPGEVIFSGDSGNDYAALVAGFRSIAVGNMEPALVNKIGAELTKKGAPELFYAAKGKATSGVLEGVRHFGLLPD